MNARETIVALTLGIVCASVLLAGSVRACGLDGVPSISADGAIAHRNTGQPGQISLAQWAPFVFSSIYRIGHAVHLSENRADLQRSLPLDALARPWRWNFGDGITGMGFSMAHTFRHGGVYKISIAAYYVEYHAWFEFDDALIRVR